MGKIFLNQSNCCAVNPATGREAEFGIEPARTPRRVLVVGAGPAGMEAARVAALRGHRVTLCEKRRRLGGNLVFSSLVYPANGKLTFTVRSRWNGGFKAEHSTAPYVIGKERASHPQDHKIRTDEPREILGGDSGISPAETLMSSLAACLTVGYAANAAAMGIDIDELKFEISGNGSLEGFMNIGDTRPGLSDISIRALVKSKAPKEKIQELHDYVNSHSPVWDTICNPVKITSRVVTD